MEVAGEQHRRRRAQAKRAIVQRQQDAAADDDGDGDGRKQRGEYPADAPHIEVGEAEPAFRQRSEEHTSELQSLMRISYAVFCLKKKITTTKNKKKKTINAHITNPITNTTHTTT